MGRSWVDYLVLLLCLCGLLAAGYLSYTHLFQRPILCTTGEGCDIVNSSAYSTFLGIPLAYIGLAWYTALVVTSFMRWRLNRSESTRSPVWRSRMDWLLFIAGLVGLVFSAYLTYLELFVIHAICTWCVTSALVMTALFCVYAIRIWHGTEELS